MKLLLSSFVATILAVFAAQIYSFLVTIVKWNRYLWDVVLFYVLYKKWVELQNYCFLIFKIDHVFLLTKQFIKINIVKSAVSNIISFMQTRRTSNCYTELNSNGNNEFLLPVVMLYPYKARRNSIKSRSHSVSNNVFVPRWYFMQILIHKNSSLIFNM